MKRTLPIHALAAVLLAAPLAGCLVQKTSRTELLVRDVRHYNEGMRWRRYEDAAAHVPPSEREAFLDERDRLDDDFNLDDYEISRVKIKSDKDTALVQVKYTWHLDSKGIVRDTVVEQRWEKRDGVWFLIDQHRKRGDDMPGVPDDEKDPATPASAPRAASSRSTSP